MKEGVEESSQYDQNENQKEALILNQGDLEKCLKEIISSTNSHKRQGPLERLFSDKAKTLKATVRALLEEIKKRENLSAHLVDNIDEEICTKNSNIMQLDKVKAQYNFDLFKEVSSQRTKLERMVSDLDREKRKERLECWHDLMFLRKYLFSALKDYWDLVKRRELVSEDL